MKKFNIYIYFNKKIYFEYFTDYTGPKKIKKNKEDLLKWLKTIKNYKIIGKKSNLYFDYKNITGLKYEIDTDKKKMKLYFLYNKNEKGFLGFTKEFEKEYNLHYEEEKIKFDKYLYNLFKFKKEDITELKNTEEEINEDGPDEQVPPLSPLSPDKAVPPLSPDETVPPLSPDKAVPPLSPVEGGKKRKTHKRKHNKKRRKTTKKR